MNRSFLLLILISICTLSIGQNRAKLNYGAALAMNDPQRQDEIINLLVKGDPATIKAEVERSGGQTISVIGSILSINIPVRSMASLAAHENVIRIEAQNPHLKLQPLHDSMLVHNRALAVHNGAAPLAQAYTGKGVVCGYIDTGIDYSHPDFKDSTGKTRIKYIWDQTLSTVGPPPPFNYGREYNENAINNNFATPHLSTASQYNGHGTHVASEGSGNGLATGQYKAMAPESDIIFVALNFNKTSGIVDAANYIFSKATAMGKPCAINCSIGDYYGSHDGTDLQAQAIKALVTAQPGRSFIAAGGNNGAVPFHLGYNVSSTDTNFTWFGGTAYIAMYGDTNTFKNIQFSIGADKPGPNYKYRGRIPFSTIAAHVGVTKYDTIWNGTNRLAVVQSFGDSLNGVYSMEFTVFPDSAYYWRLMTTGSGRFDQWSTDVIMANLADTLIYPPLKKYKQPDYNSTLVSSFQCLDEVITVGNYQNRNQHIDYDSVLQVNGGMTPGQLDPSSSKGPTRDGRIKPDVAAPGQYMMGSIVLSLFGTYSHSVLAKGGKHRIGSGTSASSPTVAGLAALYLEMDPSASWKQVKDAITYCARSDNFTGASLPNNSWGYGKADAFNALTSCAVSASGPSPVDLSVNVFPNPVQDQYLRVEFGSTTAQLQLFNSWGQKILEKKEFESGSNLFLGTLPEGIYFIRIMPSGQQNRSVKVIISR